MFDCCFQTIRCLEFVNWKLFCFLLVLFRYIVFKKQIIYLQFYSLFFNVIIWLALLLQVQIIKKYQFQNKTIILQNTYFLFNIFIIIIYLIIADCFYWLILKMILRLEKFDLHFLFLQLWKKIIFFNFNKIHMLFMWNSMLNSNMSIKLCDDHLSESYWKIKFRK